MSTRGAYGFYKEGVNKIIYNHFDSYPSGLGNDIIDYLSSKSLEDLNSDFQNIVLIGDGHNEYDSLFMSYFGIKNILDESSFMKDSLFCEWAYVINLDTNMFEVYEGFQKSKSNSRYQPYNDMDGYWGVKLIREIPLDSNLQDTWKALVKELEEED